MVDDSIKNSPCRFKMNATLVSPRFFQSQIRPLLNEEFKLMNKMIDKMYQVDVIPANLFVIHILRIMVFTWVDIRLGSRFGKNIRFSIF